MSCLQNNASVLPPLFRCESKKSRQHRHAAAVRTSSNSCVTLETTSRHPISVNPVNAHRNHPVAGIALRSRHDQPVLAEVHVLPSKGAGLTQAATAIGQDFN